MANKKVRVTYGGINQDIAKSKVQGNTYYDATNVKLTPVEGQSFGALSNAYGNKLALTLPSPQISVSNKTIYYGDKTLEYKNTEINDLSTIGGTQEINGHIETTKGVILFSTDSNGTDCIWEVPDLDVDNLDAELLYIRNMEFSISNPIQALFNYENELIQKIFWVDGKNYLRFFNKKQSIENGFEFDLIDTPVASINSKSTIDISKPTVESGGGGGVHTAGVIQYGYTLYNLNGAETSLSPLSDLYPLDKGIGEGGGNVNEVVGAMPIVTITDVDDKYTFLKLYAVKYTEYNGTPSIKLIYDGNIGNYDKFTFNDTDTHNLGSIGIAEFLFLGADPIKPNHIVAKDNILFASNNIETAYKIDIDTRAYSFNKEGTSAKIYSDVVYTGVGEVPYDGETIDIASTGYDVDEDFDCVNLDFDEYRYKDSGNSGSPGTPIIDKATYSENLSGEATVNIFSELTDEETVSLSNTCDTNNIPKTHTFELAPAGGVNNRLLITSSGRYTAGFVGLGADNDTSSTFINSSADGYMEVYSNINDTNPNRTILLGNFSIDQGQAYTGYEDVVAGEAIKIIFKIRYHYSNDYCFYQANDVEANYSYVGDGPWDGVTDAIGNTITTDYTFNYYYFAVSKIDTHDKVIPLPIVAVNGETNVSGGKFVSDYIGTVDTTTNVVINMNGLPSDRPNAFSIGLYKNDKIVNSQYLNLVNAGIMNRVFQFNGVNVDFGDELDLRLITNSHLLTGESTFSVDLNMTVGGDFSVAEGISGGDNGEGGTGKYLKYELTRTSEADLDLSLRQAKFFKDNEVYRIGIVFFNSIGQSSEAKWISDFKAPQGNLEGQFNTLKVTFNSGFYSFIDTLSEEKKPTNYAIVRAVRNPTDKTIISQGIMTSMFVQDYSSNYTASDTDDKKAGKNPDLIKVPVAFTRGYGNGTSVSDSYFPIFPTKHNRTMNRSFTLDSTRRSSDQSPLNGNANPADYVIDEIYRDLDGEHMRQQSWQFTKLMQMHSPEATFHMPLVTTDKDELHLLGFMKRNDYSLWDFNIKLDTFGPHLSDKKEFPSGEAGGFFPYSTGGFGIIGPAYRRWEGTEAARIEYLEQGYATVQPPEFARRIHTYKNFLPLERSNTSLSYEIYNRPEITEIGQSIVNYNGNTALKYINKLSTVVSDHKEKENSGGSDVKGVSNIASEGNRCLTMALGDNDLDVEDRKGIDDLYNDLNTGEWDVELFGEIRKEKNYVYSGALYGGYDVSSRSRTEYVSIGDVNDIDVSTVQIMSPGDTFVQTFRNTRLTKAPGTIYDNLTQVVCETLEYLVESTVNLEERNDTSLQKWDTIVDPTSEEGTNYNKVYSTDAVLKTYTPDNLKIREVTQAETKIIASKVKVPGEFVDSWVDFQPNEVMYLDGKYGPINNIINHYDNLFAFQDFAIAAVAVNPRVQTQGEDGVTIELGSGKVLHDYSYVSTNTGSINKWGILSASSGIYYLDSNTKQINRVEAKGISGVSEAKGLHSFLQKNLNRYILKTDNPGADAGAVLGYDMVNGDIYSSILQNGDNFNVSFNEKMSAFTSFYDFKPTRFISKGERFFTVPADNNTVWLHDKGDYQSFYGEKFEANITLIINTDSPGTEKVFNAIEFDSEVTLDDVDVSESTIDSIEAWNTYQASGKIPLEINKNIKRRFRTWRAQVPREEGSRNRLRDKWLFLKLGFNPDDNEKLILHDIIVNYAV